MKKKYEHPSKRLIEAMEEANRLIKEDDSDGQPVEVVLAELKLSCLK